LGEKRLWSLQELVDRTLSGEAGMPGVRHIDKDHIACDEDWDGNNAAFSCPIRRKVFSRKRPYALRKT
jgi:hypothetical protein